MSSQTVDDYAVEQTLEEVSIAYRLQHMELKCEGEPFDLRVARQLRNMADNLSGATA